MKPIKAILLAGAVAGALDLTDACVWVYYKSQVPPLRVFQFVASGLIGPDSMQGGIATGALGIALHFTMAMMAATFFYFASRALPVLVKYPVPCGIAYGFLFYLLMTFVVVPLSAAPMRHPPSLEWNGLFTHTILFGMPIALLVRRAWPSVRSGVLSASA